MVSRRAGLFLTGAFGHLGDELVAPAVHGADHTLGTAAVAQRLAGTLDPRCERRLADEGVTPDLLQQLALGHDPVAVLDEHDEEVEHLGLQMDR